jgi:mannose-1-phosphate guanylyltransferase
VALEAGHNLVYSDSARNITLLGVSDLLVVQTEDALLICPRDRAEHIKQLIPHLPPELH